MNPVATLDFETEAIKPRPEFPPKPVSFALRWPDGEESFVAWGHPSDNYATLRDAESILEGLWERAHRREIDILFHNAKFDLAVAEEVFGLPRLPWDAAHDSLFLAFLADPHAKDLALKPLSEDLLDWPPDEQDAMGDWIWANRKALKQEYGGDINRNAKSGLSALSAWIAKCPASIVEPYAIGDIQRTWALFEHLYPIIEREGMVQAYDRERRVLPIFMENERDGLRVDMRRLAKDIKRYKKALWSVESWMKKRLGAYGLNFDADRDVAAALDAAGVVDPDRWVKTKTGQLSVSKQNLTADCFLDQEVARAWDYRNRLSTCLSTFMVPWLQQADQCEGRIHTNWNQVRGEKGTRTGRPSTTKPNLLNIPKSFEDHEHPDHIQNLPQLPLVRRYILPEDGDVFLHRDFNSQELRIFAHYESGPLQQAYINDPDLDPHEWVRDKVWELADLDLDRTKIKALNFQAIYGGGIPAAAKMLGVSTNLARQYKRFHDDALPGRKLLNEEILRVIRANEPVVTWGGRKYFVEPPRVINGRMQTFEYKLINYICQGSAADITKEVMAQLYEHPDCESRFLAQVYDELNISAPRDRWQQQNALLQSIMENIDLDVPMRSSGKIGENWGELEKIE